MNASTRRSCSAIHAATGTGTLHWRVQRSLVEAARVGVIQPEQLRGEHDQKMARIGAQVGQGVAVPLAVFGELIAVSHRLILGIIHGYKGPVGVVAVGVRLVGLPEVVATIVAMVMTSPNCT